MPTTAQPAAGTALPSTSLTASVVFCRNEADTAPGTLLAGTATIYSGSTTDSSTYATDGDGRYKKAGLYGQSWAGNGGVSFGPAYTILQIVKRVGASGNLSAYDPNTPRCFILSGSATLVNATLFRNDNSLVGSATGPAMKTASPSSVILLTRNNSGYFGRVVVDGVAGTDLAISGTPQSASYVELLSRNGAGNPNDQLYFTAIWNRSLTDSEITTLGANPWAIFDAAPAGPTISAQPANQTVTAPATAAFSVTAAASGGGTLSYQWQRNPAGAGAFANVATGTGGTTSSYTTAATTVSGGNANSTDTWRCIVTETGGTNAGSTTSSAATLTVSSASPTINTQPSAQTVTAPATATFTVTATTSGGALSYQWQRNTVAISGATAASYTTPATTVSGGTANNGDAYRVLVTDTNGTTTSSAATLTVNAAAVVLTSSALKSNAGVLHLSAAFEAFVLNVTTGALIVRKTGLTSNATTGIVTFTDVTLTAATQYRVVWRRTDTGAQGIELLTAA